MTEKATERPWAIDPMMTDGGAPVIAGECERGHRAICKVLYHNGSEDPQVRHNAELIVKAVNNYDELASLACEMAGALEPFKQRFEKELEEMRKLVGPIPAIHARNIEALLAALSRYTAFMEGKG